jgi:O-antigen/teichoic acid export membrane protein
MIKNIKINIKESHTYMVGEILPKFLNFLLLPIMTTYLSPSDFGIIGYVDAIILFVFIFSLLSLNSYMMREYFEIDNIIDQRSMIGNFFIILSSYNIIFLILSITAINLLSKSINLSDELISVLNIALIINFLEIFNLFPQLIYRLKQNAFKYVKFTCLKTIIQLVTVLIFLEYYFYGPISKYYALFTVSFAYAIYSFFFVKVNSNFNINFTQIKSGLRFSIPLVLAALSFCIIDVSDRIILERYVSMHEVGIYSIAYALGFSINFILKGAQKAFEPQLYKSSKSKEFNNIFLLVKREFMFIVFISCCFLIMFSKEVVQIMLNSDYFEAFELMPLIILASFAKGIYAVQLILLMIKKQTKTLSAIMIFGAILNISINLVFLEKYGTIVCAISTCISFTAMATLVHYKSYNLILASNLVIIKDILLYSMLAVIVFYMYFYQSSNVEFYSIILKLFISVILCTFSYLLYADKIFFIKKFR